jgi:hypothetical protein
MASVNFPNNVGGDGSTVTDDSSPTTGLANGGFRTRLVPMFTNIINIVNWVMGQMAAAVNAAAASANSASTSAGDAATKAAAAATSASTALNAPGTSATSTTSLTIGAGAQPLTVPAGKLFVVGMYVTIASTASPSNAMAGSVTSYNSATGAMVVNVASVSGGGVFAAWTVSVSGVPGPAGPTGSVMPYIHVREQQASGTDSGASIVGTQTRVLNTVVTNTIPGASLASNQITLPAGTYRIQASAPACQNVTSMKHQASLYNVTDATTLVFGSSENVNSPSGRHSSRSVVIGSFVLTAQKALSIYHYTSAPLANDGLGGASSSGLGEVYTEVEITKVA